MPGVIAKDGNIINPPNDWNEWTLVVQKTIEHYSGKNDRNMNGVYYEVWNEPDLAQFGGWKRDSALLNYNRRTNFDTWLGAGFPFIFTSP